MAHFISFQTIILRFKHSFENHTGGLFCDTGYHTKSKYNVIRFVVSLIGYCCSLLDLHISRQNDIDIQSWSNSMVLNRFNTLLVYLL